MFENANAILLLHDQLVTASAWRQR